MKTPEEIQAEFECLPGNFEAMQVAATEPDNLHVVLAKHPLYEIEPFFAEHNNEYTDEHTPSPLIFSDEDFNPETDQLYKFKVNLESKNVHFRSEFVNEEVSYDTAFYYTEDYYKSATIYASPGNNKAIKLAYLFFKEGMPHSYIECTEYGLFSKQYKVEGNRLLGYQMEVIGANNTFDTAFAYTQEGALDSITQKHLPTGDERLIYKRPEKGEAIESVLEILENQLVEEIADQILDHIKIEEKVYCILLEYNMQGPFPPAIGIGVTSDIVGNLEDNELYELYNAPDMQYFSEAGSISIDLYTTKLAPTYLFLDRKFDIMKTSNAALLLWEEQVHQIYLRVCKRLMHFDFSACFPKTDHFLILAKDFEACNEAEYYAEMNAYKEENGL